MKAKYTDPAHEAQRAYMRTYMKQWRKNNPDKVQKYRENYWRRIAEEMGLTFHAVDTVEQMSEIVSTEGA